MSFTTTNDVIRTTSRERIEGQSNSALVSSRYELAYSIKLSHQYNKIQQVMCIYFSIYINRQSTFKSLIKS